MIIDAHQHFWKYTPEEFGWIDDSMTPLKRDYLPGDLEGQLSGAGILGTVAVQARQTLQETRWLLDLANEHPFIKGVVGWVDLCSDRLEEQLEEFSADPKFVGVRHVIHDEPDDDFMLDPDFTRGIAKLGDYDLAYDLLLFPKHLQRASRLAGMFPGQRFVLDHISKPCIKAGILDPWKEDLGALAGCPNVWCKISGMVTEADPENWKYEDFIPYLEVVLKAFGPDRLMLGSDWPVCRLAGEYRDVMNIPQRFFDGLETGLKEKIYYTNCIDFYKLNNV